MTICIEFVAFKDQHCNTKDDVKREGEAAQWEGGEAQIILEGGKKSTFQYCRLHKLLNRAVTYIFRALQGLIGTHTAINCFTTTQCSLQAGLQELQSSAHYYKAKQG